MKKGSINQVNEMIKQIKDGNIDIAQTTLSNYLEINRFSSEEISYLSEGIESRFPSIDGMNKNETIEKLFEYIDPNHITMDVLKEGYLYEINVGSKHDVHQDPNNIETNNLNSDIENTAEANQEANQEAVTEIKKDAETETKQEFKAETTKTVQQKIDVPNSSITQPSNNESISIGDQPMSEATAPKAEATAPTVEERKMPPLTLDENGEISFNSEWLDSPEGKEWLDSENAQIWMNSEQGAKYILQQVSEAERGVKFSESKLGQMWLATNAGQKWIADSMKAPTNNNGATRKSQQKKADSENKRETAANNREAAYDFMATQKYNTFTNLIKVAALPVTIAAALVTVSKSVIENQGLQIANIAADLALDASKITADATRKVAISSVTGVGQLAQDLNGLSNNLRDSAAITTTMGLDSATAAANKLAVVRDNTIDNVSNRLSLNRLNQMDLNTLMKVADESLKYHAGNVSEDNQLKLTDFKIGESAENSAQKLKFGTKVIKIDPNKTTDDIVNETIPKIKTAKDIENVVKTISQFNDNNTKVANENNASIVDSKLNIDKDASKSTSNIFNKAKLLVNNKKNALVVNKIAEATKERISSGHVELTPEQSEEMNAQLDTIVRDSNKSVIDIGNMISDVKTAITDGIKQIAANLGTNLKNMLTIGNGHNTSQAPSNTMKMA